MDTATVPGMDEAELILWRIERLQDAIDQLDNGNKSAFARRFGYLDGAFVRQMLSGKRPISDKFIRKVQEQRGMEGWFNDRGYAQLSPLEAQIMAELRGRDVPEHVLSGVLALIQGFPEKKQRVA
jgi:hypothetical protein